MSEFHVRKFKKEHRIFNVGSRGDAAYLLRSGSVEISIEKAGRKVVLAVLEPPGVSGLPARERASERCAPDHLRSLGARCRVPPNLARCPSAKAGDRLSSRQQHSCCCCCRGARSGGASFSAAWP